MSDLNLNQPTSESSELKEVCAQLQNEIFNLKLVLLIVVGALMVFFWRESSYHKFEASQMQAQATQANQLIEMLAKQDSSIEKQLTILRGAATRLGEYGKLHPDYAQILAKYGVMVTPPQAAKPAAAPTPVKK